MKKFYMFIVLLFIISGAKAQGYVTIPDTVFVQWLQTNFPTAMNGNMMDTTSPAITSVNKIYTSIPSVSNLYGLQFFDSLDTLSFITSTINVINYLPASLKYFNCAEGMVTSIVSLPISLKYLNCNSNSLTNLPALPMGLEYLNFSYNNLNSFPVLQSGLKHLECSYCNFNSLSTLPNSLEYFDCSSNHLTNLPILPSSLKYLDCHFNGLSSLPTLPSGLTSLYCTYNQLTGLPVLPNSLKILNCESNSITSMPVLPDSLERLICNDNLITNMPTLPNRLSDLICYQNQISVLPSLPSTLKNLDCSNNYINILPALPGTLESLNCSYNSISTIPYFPTTLKNINCAKNLLTNIPTLPITLESLFCHGNNLSVLPTLPSTLTYLLSGDNNLSVLPTLPDGIKILECSINHITSIPTLHDSLTSLTCSSNNLTNLPSLPMKLEYLNCSENQLTSLPSLPPNLKSLDCHNNLISCFPVFPQSFMILDSNSLSGNPFTCLPNYISAMDASLLAYPLCSSGDIINNPYNCSGLTGVVGYVYKDINGNCINDPSELKASNIHVMLYDSIDNLIAQTYSLINGAYSFQETSGTYTVKIDTVDMPFQMQCTSPGIDSTVVLTSIASTANISFPIVCNSSFDVGVQSITHHGAIFPGQTFTLFTNAGDVSAWYNLNCANGVSGQLQITVNGPVSYIGTAQGALTPTISGNIYSYSIPDFGSINNATSFGLVFFTDTSATTSQQVCVTVSISPLIGDYDTTNNNYLECLSVTNSSDPNFKEVSPVNVPPAYNGYFTYTLHFQNVGTADAINIRLADTLDTNLDMSTFRVLSYSHPNSVVLNGHVLKVFFTNIQLPDSTSNPEGSSGYFQYAIKPIANLPEFSHIENTAWIYFDYNAPIPTNTTTNVFTTASISKTNSDLPINIYPNPTSDFINISGLPSDATAEIFDIKGKMMISKQLIAPKIYIGNLANGMYFIKISSAKGCTVRKFVKR